jgi:ferredoxin
MTRRILIDRDRCIGSGNCCFFAPGTFDLDEELKSVVVDPGGDDPRDVSAAVDGCPVDAISIVEDDD